jgi:D-3-phosphoglycerate dehydrogenase
MNKLYLLFLSEVSSIDLINKLNKEFVVFRNIKHLRKEDFSNISIIWTHLDYKIDNTFIKKFPNVKYVVSPVTGVNHLDVDYLNLLKIKLITLRGEKSFLKKISATAEHTWSIFLALQRNIIKAHYSITDDLNFDRNNFDSTQISGKSIGIIGYGRIGKMIAQYALSFKMRVFVNDILEVKTNKKVSYLSLDNLLIRSDYIFLTASYSKEYIYFFDINKFKLMKESSFFVNTSRGELVNESDLIYALKNKIISGAALDVFNNEIHFDCNTNELVKYARDNSNLILTPHIGGRSSEALDLVEHYLLNKLKKLI